MEFFYLRAFFYTKTRTSFTQNPQVNRDKKKFLKIYGEKCGELWGIL